MAYSGPTFVGISTGAGAAAATSISFSSSGRAAGDMLLVGVETANQAIAAPTGFTQTPGAGNPLGQGTPAAFTGVSGTVFDKQSDGTETTVAIPDSGNHQYAAGLVVRPSGGATAVEVAVLASGSAPQGTPRVGRTFGAITTTDDDCLIVTFVFSDLDLASASWDTSPAPTGGGANLTKRFDNGTAAGAGGGVAIFTSEKESAGAVPDITADNVGVAGHIWITLAIRNVAPPAAATPYSFGFIA